MPDHAPYGLLLSDDLIDGSKVTATARANGWRVTQLRSVDAVIAAAAEQSPGCVMADLHHAGLDLTSFVRALKEASPSACLIGFGSHVDAARLKAARLAGFDRVMPRSQFFDEMPTRLGEWLARLS